MHTRVPSWLQVSDLQERLAFIYRWACEGPPVVIPLGMLAKPKAYLTSVQQVRACPSVLWWVWVVCARKSPLPPMCKAEQLIIPCVLGEHRISPMELYLPCQKWLYRVANRA
eukprot:247509-Pelagomonas_calceolata.AAC.3